MVESFYGFKSSDGRIHAEEYEAWKHEFALWLKKHGVTNEGIVASLVKAVDDGQPGTLASLQLIIDGMRRNAPPVEVVADVTAATWVIHPNHSALIKCMGGESCNHPLGTCTATIGSVTG